MVKIEDSDPKNTSGSYARLFGDADLGQLISRVQSASIRAGNELEDIISKTARSINIVEGVDDLDSFLDLEIMPDGSFIATKAQIKKSMKINFSGAEPDFMVFQRKGGKQTCKIVELKDGHVFDTKKVAGERKSIHDFISRNAQHIPYTVTAHFCSFNKNDKAEILKGFKNKISYQEAMTGKEFCELLVLDYGEIVKMREKNQTANITYFLSQLILLQEDAIKKILDSDG